MYKSNQHFVLWTTSSESSHKIINYVSNNLSFDIHIHTPENLCFDNKIYIYSKHTLFWKMSPTTSTPQLNTYILNYNPNFSNWGVPNLLVLVKYNILNSSM